MLSVVSGRPRILQWKCLTLDLDARRAKVSGTPLSITAAEFALLNLLVSRRNVPMSKDVILATLFGAGTDRDPRMVDVFVARLRAALAAHGLTGIIEAVSGRGYAVLDPDEQGNDPATPAADHGVFALLAA